MKDKIIEQVVEKFQQRSERGISKYNTTLDENNKDNYLIHLQDELMDACGYIQKLLQQRKDLIQLVNDHPNDYELGRVVREFVK